MKRELTLQQFVSHLKDASTRFQIDVERGLAQNPTLYKPKASFSDWWRAFYHYLRSDNPKTLAPALKHKPPRSDA